MSRRHLLAALLLAAVALLAYANSFTAGFTLDNYFLILADPRLHQASFENLRSIATRDYWVTQYVSGVYRPLTTLSYLFNYAILGNARDPAGYHAVNLILHWGNALLVYALVLPLLGGAWPALLAAALFTAHPIATEAVTNIVGRADLLAAAAVLGGALLHRTAAQVIGWRRAAALVALFVAAALGLLSKESAVLLLPAAVVLDLTRRSPFARGWVVVGLAMAAVWLLRARLYTDVAIHEIPFLENPLVGAGFWTARLTAVKVIGRYAALLVWPRALSCDYSYDQVPLVTWRFTTWEDWQALLALGGLGLAALLAVRHFHRREPAFFFVAFFLATLLPASNLFVLIPTIMAERLLYLPSVGFAGGLVLLVSALCQRVTPRPALAGVMLGVIVVAYGTRTHLRNADWQDDLRLYQSAQTAAPRSYKPYLALAATLAQRGGDIDRVVAEAEKALAIVERASLPAGSMPVPLLRSLAEYYGRKATALGPATRAGRGWYEKSVDMLEGAAVAAQARREEERQRAPNRRAQVSTEVALRRILGPLAAAQVQLGRYEKALTTLADLHRVAPHEVRTTLDLARLQMAAGQLERAAGSALQVLALEPASVEAGRFLVAVYERLDPDGCALNRDGERAEIDQACPAVRAATCAARAALAGLMLDAGQAERARDVARQALADVHCPRAEFARVLGELGE
jgi:tetratricopeptide (TPR) repeat protein